MRTRWETSRLKVEVHILILKFPGVPFATLISPQDLMFVAFGNKEKPPLAQVVLIFYFSTYRSGNRFLRSATFGASFITIYG